ncbi:MAG: J domain-containing protein [Polaribacter sp.]
MNTQYNLFNEQEQTSVEDEKKATTNQRKITLVLDKKASDKDQKKKKAIDKKIQKIDALKNQIEKINKQLSDVKKLYNEKATKVEKEFYKLKEEFILKLYSRSKENGFAVWQKELMFELIIEECSFLAENEYFSEKTTKVQEEIMEIKTKELDEEEKKDLNSIYEGFFEGMDIDLGNDFDFSKMNDPEYKERIFQQFHQKNQEYKDGENIKERQGKVQKTDKEFQKLYKQLVRKVHPDLVTSDKEKTEREIVMKKLTEAWDNRNYFELLVLQKEIEGEVNTEAFIGVGQLNTLTKQLNLEISKLEQEKWLLKSHMGENYFFVKNFFARTKTGIEKKINEYLLHLENEKSYAKNQLINLKSKASTKRYLTDIYDNQNNNFDIFDVFDNM